MSDWLTQLPPAIETLGWTLVHFVWQGAVLGLIFFALMRICAGASPRVRYGIGMMLLVATLVVPLATFITLHESASAAGLQKVLSARAEVALERVVPAEAASTLDLVRDRLELVLPWIVVLWGIGVAFLSMRVAIGWRQLRRIATRGVRPLGGEWPERIQALRSALGIRQSIQVLESSIVAVPTVMGFLKPVVLMPTACLLRMSTDQLELLIAHELGHVRRWDYLANLLQVVIETLLFYHPAVRWMSRRVRAEREQCCDDLVVAHCGRAMTYAKALTNLESLRAGLPAPALAATGGQLTNRVERLVLPRSEHRRRGGAGNFTVIALIAVVVIATARHTTSPVEQITARVPAAELPPVVDVAIEPSVSTAAQAENTVPSTPIADVDELVVTTPARIAAAVSTPETVATEPAASEIARASVNDSAPVAVESPPAEPVVQTATAQETQPATSIPESTTSAAEASPALANEVALVPPPEESVIEAATTNAPAPLREVNIDPAALSRTLEPPPAPPTGPVATRRVAPEFPRRARISGVQGYVNLSFLVRPDGRVSDVRIEQSSPPRMFDKAARRAIGRWKFDPTTVAAGGERVTQRFDFALGKPKVAAKPADDVPDCRRMTGTRLCLDQQ